VRIGGSRDAQKFSRPSVAFLSFLPPVYANSHMTLNIPSKISEKNISIIREKAHIRPMKIMRQITCRSSRDVRSTAHQQNTDIRSF
jgi:hypothetical protein